MLPTRSNGRRSLPAPAHLAARLTLSGVLLASLAAPAHAGWLDSIFGKSSSEAPAAPAKSGSAKNRSWQLHEFTAIKLVPREPGSEPNQQPVRVDPEALRLQLGAIQAKVLDGGRQPLFAISELAELLQPLMQALENAGPDDDILLLSADRREGGFIGSPMAVTARIFVDRNGLQVIVHDTRQDFYDKYRGTNQPPLFIFGTRASASDAVLQSPGATSRRADWLAIPMNVAGARQAALAQPALAPIGAAAPGAALPVLSAPALAAAPMVAAAPAPMLAPVAVAPVAAAAIAVPAAAPAMPIGEPERRLETLKRLHDKGLITDEEFQEKRKDILKSL